MTTVKPSDYMRFLQQQAWFIKGADALGENFPLAVRNLLIRLTHRFVCRRDTLLLHLSEGELTAAFSGGAFKSVLLSEVERVVTAQMP